MLKLLIPLDNIVRIKPAISKVINGRRESMAQVKARTGCDIIVNAGTYNMTTYALDSGLKIDGATLKNDEYYGFGSNDEKSLEFSYAGKWHKDYFGCYKDYIRDGVYQPMLNDKSKRGRTGIGIKGNSLVVVSIADTDKANRCGSTSFMRKYFSDCQYALNLDGGGSSQCIAPSGSFISGRLVAWYLCIWLKPSDKQTYTVTARTGLRVRENPSLLSATCGLLPHGTSIDVVDIANGWAKVVYNGEYGYCSTAYLKKVE